MSIAAADQAKDRGNQAYASKNFKQAVAEFSEAIAINASGANSHVYYSNRSASYLNLGESSKALGDAEMCITMKPDWPKGYSRKGAALFHLKRYAEAQKVYAHGLTLDPTNTGLMGGRDQCCSMLDRPTILSFFLHSNHRIHSIQFILRFVSWVLCVAHFLPLVSRLSSFYGNFFLVSIVNYSISLFSTHGRPQLKPEYAIKIAQDPSMHYLFYSVLFWVTSSTKPYSLAMVPVVLIEGLHLARFGQRICQTCGYQDVLDQTHALVNTLSSKMNMPPQMMSLHQMTQINVNFSAQLMVLFGINFVLEWFTPYRDMVFTFIYWQFLRMMYVLSAPVQDAFKSVDTMLLKGTSSNYCPQLIARGYFKLRQVMGHMARPPTQNSTRSGLSRFVPSSCSIM